MTEKLGVDEVAESLNHWDDIAIEKHWGQTWNELPPMRVMRALLFVVERRAGKTDKDAFKAVADMTLREVNDRFDLTEELDPEEPYTDQGKGDEPLG